VGNRRFRKVQRGYHRSQEKSDFMSRLDDEFYDPDIESPYVAGGDPGLAVLMASALEAAVVESRTPADDVDGVEYPAYPPDPPVLGNLGPDMQRLWTQMQQGMAH